MSGINTEFVERYQLEYEKNPKSKVFAPLAEAYRKMGLFDEALNICRRGVMMHPDFSSGRVAFAKVLIDRKQYSAAIDQLVKAIDLSPDNLLAHSLIGESWLALRNPKEALKAFKMVLFLNPGDTRAQEIVRKWEFLSAEDFDDEAFAMKPLFRPETQALLPPLNDHRQDDQRLDDQRSGHSQSSARLTRHHRELERALSVADAFTIRGEQNNAAEFLNSAIQQLGSHPELYNRRRLLGENNSRPNIQPDPQSSPLFERNRALLESFLQRINERRDSPSSS
jgi:tetratricopeptide (TPR) repeat protein